MMYNVSFEEFMRLVEIGRRVSNERSKPNSQVFVLRPDQQIFSSQRQEHTRRLATCPECDAVVDADQLHPHSGLCPRCHELHRWQR